MADLDTEALRLGRFRRHPRSGTWSARFVLEAELRLVPDSLKAIDDRVKKAVEAVCRRYDTFSISSHRPESLKRLLVAIEQRLWKGTPSTILPVASGELVEERYHNSLRRVGGEHG